jgi:hypothetical protein
VHAAIDAGALAWLALMTVIWLAIKSFVGIAHGECCAALDSGGTVAVSPNQISSANADYGRDAIFREGNLGAARRRHSDIRHTRSVWISPRTYSRSTASMRRRRSLSGSN